MNNKVPIVKKVVYFNGKIYEYNLFDYKPEPEFSNTVLISMLVFETKRKPTALKFEISETDNDGYVRLDSFQMHKRLEATFSPYPVDVTNLPPLPSKPSYDSKEVQEFKNYFTKTYGSKSNFDLLYQLAN